MDPYEQGRWIDDAQDCDCAWPHLPTGITGDGYDCLRWIRLSIRALHSMVVSHAVIG